MRLLLPILLAVASSAPAQPAVVGSPALNRPSILQGPNCQSATSQFAGNGSAWRNEPLKPQKLSELPPADTYAAVYRRDERGCIIPVMYPGTRARQR